jgi:hypothetical protein
MASALDQYDPVFEEAGREWNVDPRLLKAMAAQESAGNARAVSRAGARGLMQIMPDTGQGLGLTDPENPVDSIWAGAKYMSHALDAEQGDVRRALWFYHGGPQWGAPGKFGPESQAYVPAIEARYAALAPPKPAGGAITARNGAKSPAPDAPDKPASGAKADESVDDFLARTGGGGANAARNGAKGDDVDAFLKRTGGAVAPPAAAPTPSDKPSDVASTGVGDLGGNLDPALASGNYPPPAPTPPGQDAAADAAVRGVRRNIAAGVLEGAGGVLNAAANPSGTLGGLLATGLVTGADALSRVFGGKGVPDDLRRLLLEEQVQQPGSAAINWLGHNLPGQDVAPESVPVTTDTELLARKAAAGATQMGVAGPIGAARSALAGALGAGVGHYVGQDVPEWARPGAETAANLLATGLGTQLLRAPPVPPERLTLNLPPQARLEGPPGEPVGSGPTPGGAVLEGEVIPPGGSAQASPGMGGPIPQSAGAAATGAGAPQMTMEEFKANRKQGELNEIMRPPQGEDNTIYVPPSDVAPAGSVPTLAERKFNPVTSQKETLLRERAADEFKARLQANNAARVALYEEDMGSAPARAAINRDISELAQREQPRVLANAGPLDLRQTAELADSIMTDPRLAERDAVQKVVRPLRDALFDENGELKTDVRAGWGMIDNIRDKIERAGLETSQERFVVGQLLQLKDTLTAAMNDATSGRFGEYMDQLTQLYQRRNAMDVLQNFRTRLTNSQGEISFPAYHRWLLGLAKQRGAPGTDPAMSIPDSTMRKLIAIDHDLKRGLNIDLGKGRGSPTNLLFALSQAMGLGLVHAAVHGGVAAMGGGGLGNIFAQQGLSAAQQKILLANMRRNVRKHLAPPPQGPTWLSDEP